MRDLLNNNVPHAPCKECHEKGENFLGCHDKCEKYKEFKRLSKEANDKVSKQKDFERMFYAEKRNVCLKVLKHKKK